MGKNYTNQHIVPKRYLNRFGTPDGKKTLIGTRTTEKGKPRFFRDATSNVGYVKNIYDVTDKSDPKYWEHFFAREIDSLCGKPMQNIIAKVTLSQENTIVLSEQDKETLAKIIVAQLMRIPENFQYVTNKMYPKISAQVKAGIAAVLPQSLIDQYGDRIQSIELSEQEQKELILNHAFNPDNFDRYCGILKAGVWAVYYNAERNVMPFATSDNPVLVEGIGSKETGLLRNGLANPGTCVFYPLTPSVAVAIYSRWGIIGDSIKQCDGRKLILKDLDYITQQNIKLIAQAYYHSFLPHPLYDLILYDMEHGLNTPDK